jgi:dTDP-4-amino-4,6-dideoxygalactose transaminase
VSGQTLALHGGHAVRQAPFPEWPVWTDEEEQALLTVLRSGQWGSAGSGTGEVKSFEEEFAQFQGAKHAVAVCNGTMALAAALRAVGVGHGDEVIVPPYTFIATASSVLQVGAVPAFADVQSDTLLIDPEKVEQLITPRTKAVIGVHIGGAVCDMDALVEVCRRHGLHLIEDAAQAHGARWRDQGCGTIGDLGTFSFQSSKNVNAGEGGMVLCSTEELAEMTWSVANVGRIRGGGWYQHEIIGWNLRLTEWQAAILRVQLRRCPEQMERRERNATMLTESLQGVPGIRVLARDPRVTKHAWHIYAVWVDAPGGAKAVAEAMVAEGVPCGKGYVPLNRNRALCKEAAELSPDGSYEAAACPVAEAADNEILWFSQRMLLGEGQDVEDIAVALEKVMRGLSS